MTKEPRATQPEVEKLLRNQRVGFELRSAAEGELSYEVRLPIDRSTDALTKAVLGTPGATAVDWAEEKKKQPGEA
jgi:hypothetical protein